MTTTSAFLGLIDIVFSIYIYILILRLFLQKFSARYSNPIIRSIINVTEPLIKPCQRFMPGFKGFDLAIVLLLVIFSAIQICLSAWLTYRVFPGFFGLLIITVASLLNKIVNLFFIVVIISAILSWFPALQNSLLTEIINTLAEPLVRFARRFIPSLGGFDFSPLVIIVVLKLISIFVLLPLISFGLRLGA